MENTNLQTKNENEKTAFKIQTMSENEKLIGELYRSLALKFPEEKTFWQAIALEEDRHWEMLLGLSKKISEGKAALSTENFSLYDLKNFQDTIIEKKKNIEKQNLTVVQALEEALELEIAFFERKYFDIFKSADPVLRDIFSELEKETKNHVDRIVEKIGLYSAA